MNEVYQDNKKVLIALLVVLLLAAAALFYFLVMPLKSGIKSSNNAIVSLENDKQYYQTLIDNLMNAEPELNVEELLYEKRIPKESNVDEYILSLQNLELVAGSRINSIAFVYDSGIEIVDDGEETAVEQPAETPVADGEQAEGDAEAPETPVTPDPAIINEKPSSLQVIAVNITAKARNFEEFLNLIETIENQERISIVSNLTFTKPGEVAQITGAHVLDREMIEFTAQLTTFYYPGN